MIMDESLKSHEPALLATKHSAATDNIADILHKIIEFARKRHKILLANIKNADLPGFMPRDLPVEHFADLLHVALNEHVRSRRLLFRDSESVKFGHYGACAVQAVADTIARRFLHHDKDRYLELQTEKLMENALNQNLATALLAKKPVGGPLGG